MLLGAGQPVRPVGIVGRHRQGKRELAGAEIGQARRGAHPLQRSLVGVDAGGEFGTCRLRGYLQVDHRRTAAECDPSGNGSGNRHRHHGEAQ